MADIYQEIWDADRECCGIKALAKGTKIDAHTKANGYVIVDKDYNRNRHHRVLTEMVIPDRKEASYQRVEKIFNNYTLDQTKREINTAEEEREIGGFIRAIAKSQPMLVAKDYISKQSGRKLYEDVWYDLIYRIWFEQFDMGGNKDLSGFEHVILGEQQEGRAQGYHFWYKYYVDERFWFNNQELDLINFLGLDGNGDRHCVDVVHLSYEWNAFDYEQKRFRKLTKPKGVFWVGPSVEGLMAIATVRFLPEALAPKQATINGSVYQLKLFRSPDERHLRTFYPEFIGFT
jgi:hypothetical protein